MTDNPHETEATNRLLRAAFTGGNSEILRDVIGAVAGVDVVELDVRDGGDEIEVWMGSPGAITGSELRDLQRLFEIGEMGVYGDPNLAGTPEGDRTDGAFHAVLSPAVDGE